MKRDDVMESAYRYALAKSLCDEGLDYLDCFWVFAMKTLPNNKQLITENEIQSSVRNEFGIEIPIHTLRAVLRRALQKKYIVQDENQYGITDIGISYVESLETEREIQRRLKALFDDISNFIKGSINIVPTEQQIQQGLSYLSYKQAECLMQLLGTRGPVQSEGTVSKKMTRLRNQLLKYIEIAEERKPEYYETLRDIFYGSIITMALNCQDPSALNELRTSRFKHVQVYLDTNFVFSKLGLHSPESNLSAQELFSLLDKSKFDIKVFDFTIEEICDVISGYVLKQNRYPINIRISTIYSELKRQGWTQSDARNFITNVDDNLLKHGIKIERFNDIDLYCSPLRQGFC